MFWYRRRGTQAKRRKLVPWHGITSREPNTPRPHRTPPYHPVESHVSLNKPTGPKCPLSLLSRPRSCRAATPTAGDGRLRQLGRHRLEPDRGTPILLPPLPRALPSPPLAPSPPTRLPLHARPCFAFHLLYRVGGRGSEFYAARASAGAAPTPRLRDLVGSARILFPCLRLGWSELWGG
jgi:hypothetical protein